MTVLLLGVVNPWYRMMSVAISSLSATTQKAQCRGMPIEVTVIRSKNTNSAHILFRFVGELPIVLF